MISNGKGEHACERNAEPYNPLEPVGDVARGVLETFMRVMSHDE